MDIILRFRKWLDIQRIKRKGRKLIPQTDHVILTRDDDCQEEKKKMANVNKPPYYFKEDKNDE